MRRLVMTLACVLWLTGSAWAACTGSSPSWSCSSWTDMETLIEGASLQTGDTVTLSSGTHVANSSISIPASKRITVRGSGTLGTTVSTSSAVSLIAIGVSQSRVTNFAFTSTNSGVYFVSASHINWRVDNNTFDCRPSGAKCRAIMYANQNLYCPTYYPGGVIHNNTFYDARFEARGSAFAEHANGLACHAMALDLGGPTAVYVEDNTFISYQFGNLHDCDYGGAYVSRFNTMNKIGNTGGYPYEIHPFNGRGERGSRKYEIYNNTITHGDYRTMSIRGGAGFIFNNTITAGAYGEIVLQNDRSVAGGCDGVSADSLMVDSNEVTSGADKGWLCRDQIGAGKDTYAWTGTGNYPPQEKVPTYVWGNGVSTRSTAAHVVRGRDFYDETSDGVRTGTSFPATCTTGQGYWKTNEGYWNSRTPGVAAGVLYKCTATNTWTPYYIPYPYPHPLRSGLSAPSGVTVK